MNPDDTWTPAKQKAERAAMRGRVLEGLAIVAVVVLVVAIAAAVSS